MPKPSKPRDHTPINVWTPTIHDTPITTIPQLHHILDTDYPGLQRNPNYLIWLHDAETHLTLTHHLKGKTHLQRGDRKRLGKELGITRQKFTAWAQDARQPRLYYELDRMLSKSQANRIIAQLHQKNNGITSTEDILTQLATYYPNPELSTSKHHHKRLTQCTQYFHALSLLKNGGAYLDVARTLNVHHSQIMRWFDGHRPDYLELTRRIPQQPPEPNHQWLPLTMEGNFHPTNFIHVPKTIETWTQIQKVIQQTQPLNTPQIRRWQDQFGNITKDAAFAYLLGIIVSDCGKTSINRTSHRIDLRLSKEYTWSYQVGEATCYYLGQLGIRAKLVGDRDSSTGKNTCHSWNSENSPLLQWIDKTCLGLESDQRTTYTAIKAKWLISAPKSIRIKFLQGLNDGDGWASTKDQALGNACEPNIPFIKELLKSLGIHSTEDGRRIRIKRQKSVLLAVKLPYFLHAAERQKSAEKLAKMIRARRETNPEFIPQRVINEVHRLDTKGLSKGIIAELIFDKFGFSYDKRRILYILKKQSKE
jgi:hypothetical protein